MNTFPKTMLNGHQDLVRFSVYSVVIIVAFSSIAGLPATLASLAAAAVALGLFHFLNERGLRTIAMFGLGILVVLVGQLLANLAGSFVIVPRLLGIDATLTALQCLSLGSATLGLVLALRSLSNGTHALGIFDSLTVTLAIAGRFAAHQGFQWSHPRFLADWAGMHGYELPLIFAMVGAATILLAMVAGMRASTWQRSLGSVLFLLLLIAMLFFLGSRVLRNPRMTLRTPAGASQANSAQNSAAGNATASAAGLGQDASQGSQASAGAGNADAPDLMPTAGKQPPSPIAMVLLEKECKPYEGVWYLRHTAASQFNGTRMVVSSSAAIDADIIAGFAETHQQVTIPLPETMHDIVPMKVNLLVEQPRPFGLVCMMEYESLPNPDPDYFRHCYRATSRVLQNPVVDGVEYDLYSDLSYAKAGDAAWNQETWDHYLSGPDDERYRELAQQIVSDEVDLAAMDESLHESPMLKALAIKRWLEKNTLYSLDPQLDAAGENPAEQFLFGKQTGYCVHIAHAGVYLMRSLGIPARIGIGYSVPLERSGTSASILIQSTDGHAWPEVFIEGVGWVVVDIHPEQVDATTRLPREPDPSVSKFLADRARGKSNHQSELAQSNLGNGKGGRRMHRRWNLSSLAIGLLLLAVILLYAVKLLIRFSPHLVSRDWLSRATYLAAVLRLAEIGMQRRFGETREQFAERVHAFCPQFQTLTNAHLVAAFGNDLQWQRVCWLSLDLQVGDAIRAESVWWRRWLGLADPRIWSMLR